MKDDDDDPPPRLPKIFPVGIAVGVVLAAVGLAIWILRK